MRKKTMHALLCSLLLPCALTAMAADADKGRLVVGIPVGLPGYELQPSGVLRISDAFKQRFTDCVAKDLRVTFEWQALPTKRVIQMLMTNELDLIYPMGFTEERASQMAQSAPAWQNPDVWVSLDTIAPSNKMLRIAARMGSPQHTDYVADGYANLVPVYAYEDLSKMLGRKAVDAAIVPRSVYLEQRKIWPEGARTTYGKPRSSGFYLNLDDPKRLLTRVNSSIGRCQDALATK